MILNGFKVRVFPVEKNRLYDKKFCNTLLCKFAEAILKKQKLFLNSYFLVLFARGILISILLVPFDIFR